MKTTQAVSREAVEKLTDAELDRLIARENLIRYGSVAAPVTGTRALQVVADPDEPDEAPDDEDRLDEGGEALPPLPRGQGDRARVRAGA
jgi:hypothetical protein